MASWAAPENKLKGFLGEDLPFLRQVGSMVKTQCGKESEGSIKNENPLRRALGPALGLIERPPEAGMRVAPICGALWLCIFDPLGTRSRWREEDFAAGLTWGL